MNPADGDLIEIKEPFRPRGTMGATRPDSRNAMSLLETLSAEHRACDARFVEIEQAIHAGDRAAAQRAASAFTDATEAHFRYEENVLFPALESATPMAAGPVSVMRAEHTQMRELLAEIAPAIESGDDAMLGEVLDTLLLVMQQHNAKEENVLYPLADRALDAAVLVASKAGEADRWNR